MTDEQEIKTYKLEEVAKNNKEESLWIVIHDAVYDLTSFLCEHPGGEAVLLENAGKIASENFDDVGHSAGARELMKDYKIGELVEEEKQHAVPTTQWDLKSTKEGSSWWKAWVLPLAIGVAVSITIRAYFFSS